LSGIIYAVFGRYEKGVGEATEATRLNPDSPISYSILKFNYIALNRLDEAKAAYGQALEHKLNHPFFHSNLYDIAFLQNDAKGMAQQVAWGAGKPGVEEGLLASEADTAGYSGQLAKARELSRRAVATAQRAEGKEAAAGYEGGAAVREALFSNPAEARHRAGAALTLSNGRDAQFGAALALALAGDMPRAQALANDLAERFPADTLVLFNYLPTIRALLSLSRNDSSKAIAILQATAPCELGTFGTGSFAPALYPAYVRGEAYLTAHQGSEAAVEFQKILDHRGIVVNGPIGALARLGLARAYVLQGDSAKAKAAYHNFLTLWKDADPDVRILKQAKAEYAKLQ
jgi:eukaryotic-like serine/threonine-protein kinase